MDKLKLILTIVAMMCLASCYSEATGTTATIENGTITSKGIDRTNGNQFFIEWYEDGERLAEYVTEYEYKRYEVGDRYERGNLWMD